MISFSFHSLAYYATTVIGHPYIYHRCCQKAVEDIGGKFFGYTTLSCTIEPLAEGWFKWFHPIHNRKGRRGFFKDCIKLFKAKAEEEKRIFFLEFFGRRDFRLFALAALIFAKKRDQIWVLYRDDFTTKRKKDWSAVFTFTHLLKRRFGKRFVTLTDSALLATYYEKQFKQPLPVMPIPHALAKEPLWPLAEKVVCSWPGEPRKDKGSKEIAKLTQINDPLAARVVLDTSGAVLFPSLKNQIQLQLRRVGLDHEEYFKTLFASDVVLLPYDPHLYKWRTSGIFVEAVIAGKIPLVKEGSWLAFELKRFQLSELIVDWENPSFFTHLFTLLQKEEVREKLARMQKSYIQEHNLPVFTEKMREIICK